MANVPRRPDPFLTSQYRLRQIALITNDLKETERILTHVLGTEVVYEDPQVSQWALRNSLIAIGGDIIEVVSPIESNTTAGRLLAKRGDGGYMVIMQTVDAKAHRAKIESHGLARVIHAHEQDDSVCVQYHPKDIKGGVIPELDSHLPTSSNPTPVTTRFSPWHACGSLSSYPKYSTVMKSHADLYLVGAVLRLEPGDSSSEAASRQWEQIFGVPRSRDLLAFTNARLGFIRGEEGKQEGLESITIAVKGRKKFEGILKRASEEALCGDGWINMCGVRWYFVEAGEPGERSSL